MKPPILKSLILVVAILFTVKADAQRYWDYVITVNGDSIRCNITQTFLGGLVYKNAAMSKPKKITPDSVKEYYVVTDQKVSKAVIKGESGKPVFFSIIEKGKLSLYEYLYVSTRSTGIGYGGMSTNTTSSSVIEYYIGIGGDKVELLAGGILLTEPHLRQKDFGEIIKDNKNVYDKFISDNSFSHEEIRNIVHLYNTGEQFIDIGPVDPFAKDYVVTKTNDTINGRLKDDYFKGYFTFKKNSQDDFAEIDSTRIKEYFCGRENADFILKKLPGQNTTEFVKWIKKGRLNLYEQDRKTKYYWYISKDSGPLVTIKADASAGDDIRSHREFLRAFKNLISDNKELLGQFNDAASGSGENSYFSSDEVVQRIINSYNIAYSKNKSQ